MSTLKTTSQEISSAISDVSGSEALLAVNDEGLKGSLEQKGVDGTQLNNLADQCNEVRHDLLNDTRTYDRPIWNAADASMPAENFAGMEEGAPALLDKAARGDGLSSSFGNLNLRQMSQISGGSCSSNSSENSFRDVSLSVCDECTISIDVGTLGINIFECTEHNPAYRVQFNYFTGTSEAEQLAAGRLKEGMSLTHVGDVDQIGMSYKEVVKGLAVRPCKLRFEESDFSRKVQAETKVRASMSHKKPRLTVGGYGNAASAVTQRFRIKSKVAGTKKTSYAALGGEEIASLVLTIVAEGRGATGAPLNYMTLKARLRERMERDLKDEEKAMLTTILQKEAEQMEQRESMVEAGVGLDQSVAWQKGNRIKVINESSKKGAEGVVVDPVDPSWIGQIKVMLDGFEDIGTPSYLPSELMNLTRGGGGDIGKAVEPPLSPDRPQLVVASPPPPPIPQAEANREEDRDRVLLSQPLVDLGLDHVPVYSCPVANDYQLGQELGSGSFCSVRVGKERPHLAGRGSFLASSGHGGRARASSVGHYGLNALRAIKIFDRSPKALSSSEREQVAYELLLLAQASQCEFVVRLFSVYETPATLCMVTELCAGGEVFQTVSDKGAFPQPLALHMMRCLMTALAYLHIDQRVVHRDVKLENMLLSRPADGDDFREVDFTSSKSSSGKKRLICKLADFGLARRLAPVTKGQQQVVEGSAVPTSTAQKTGDGGVEGVHTEGVSPRLSSDLLTQFTEMKHEEDEEDYDDFDEAAELEQRNTLCGSGDYIAPEVFKHNGYGLKVCSSTTCAAAPLVQHQRPSTVCLHAVACACCCLCMMLPVHVVACACCCPLPQGVFENSS
jgi:serine/threonine protein kinase